MIKDGGKDATGVIGRRNSRRYYKQMGQQGFSKIVPDLLTGRVRAFAVTILRVRDEPNDIMIDLEFDSLGEAEACLQTMQRSGKDLVER
jgi:hypothetical protein